MNYEVSFLKFSLTVAATVVVVVLVHNPETFFIPIYHPGYRDHIATL